MINKTNREHYSEDASIHTCGLFCISWSSIIIGALVGIGLAFLLNLFGVAIGLSAFTTTAGTKSLAVGAYIAMIIAVMISTFVSGWVAGYLGREQLHNPYIGVLYGFTVWCITLIVGIILSASVGQFINSQYGMLSDHNANIIKLASPSIGSEGTNTGTSMHGMQSNLQTPISPNNQQAIKSVGKVLLLTFILFLVGAITSAFGGYTGIKQDNLKRKRKNA